MFIPSWTLTTCSVQFLCCSLLPLERAAFPNWLTGSLAVAALVVHAFSGVQAARLSLAVMVVLTLAGALVFTRPAASAEATSSLASPHRAC